MLLLELFNDVSPFTWKWRFKDSEEAEAEFKVGDVVYLFYAYLDDLKASTHWELEFKVATGSGSKRFELTGTGNSQKVMSTVVTIIKDFLKSYDKKVDKISFAAKEESRKGLYSKMIHRLIPTWKLETAETKYEGQRFILTAPKESK